MKYKGFLTGLCSTIVLVGIWQIASMAVALPFILPTPGSVLADSINLVITPSYAGMLLATCARGIIAFLLSLFLSFVLGITSGMYPAASAALRPWMTIIKATPVVSFILIALLWFGSSTVPVFVAILMTMPVMTVAIAQGVRSSDTKLLEMAQVYHFSKLDILFHIRLPSAMPFFLSGAGTSLGLTWKVVVAGEILSSPKYGLGSAMQTAKVHLETPRVFSLTIAAILLSIMTELLFDFFVFLSRRHITADEA